MCYFGTMALREDFEQAGNWLFRRRSFLPLLLLPLFYPALSGFRYAGGSHGLDLIWEIGCLAVSLTGYGLRIATVGFAPRGTSGRNRHEQIARSLNTTGMYSLVRHPLYLGNYVMWLGASAVPRVWWLPVLVTLAFALYYERIMFAEEEFLRREFGAAFTDWASRTPAIVPRRLAWIPPGRPFSLREVLRQEYSGLFALVTVYSLLEVGSDIAATGRLEVDPVWGTIFILTVALTVVLRALKHRPQGAPVP